MQQNRAKVIDYMIVFDVVAKGWFYIKNPRNTYDWTFFFQPLYGEAWIGLIIFSFVIPILITILSSFRE